MMFDRVQSENPDVPVEDAFVVPAWFSQQKSWLEDPANSDSAVYNYSLLLRIRGPLDENALRRSLHEIVRRHQVLRSVFRIMSGELIQIVVPPPIQSKGIEAYRKTWDLFFSWSKASGVFDISEMNITAGNDVAFVTALMHCAGTEANGDKIELEFRLTIGLRKIDGQWIVMHEHHSIPAS